MKTDAILIKGEYFYWAIGPNDTELVPTEQIPAVHEMMRYQQIDLYMNRCEEQSCEIVEGRVYDISGGERIVLPSSINLAKSERNKCLDEVNEIVFDFETGLLNEKYHGMTLRQILESLKIK